jgi:hypothetical protein
VLITSYSFLLFNVLRQVPILQRFRHQSYPSTMNYLHSLFSLIVTGEILIANLLRLIIVSAHTPSQVYNGFNPVSANYALHLWSCPRPCLLRYLRARGFCLSLVPILCVLLLPFGSSDKSKTSSASYVRIIRTS